MVACKTVLPITAHVYVMSQKIKEIIGLYVNTKTQPGCIRKCSVTVHSVM